MAEEEKQDIAKKNMLDVIMEWSLARKLSLIGASIVCAILFRSLSCSLKSQITVCCLQICPVEMPHRWWNG